jgi:hypothetical protein
MPSLPPVKHSRFASWAAWWCEMGALSSWASRQMRDMTSFRRFGPWVLILSNRADALSKLMTWVSNHFLKKGSATVTRSISRMNLCVRSCLRQSNPSPKASSPIMSNVVHTKVRSRSIGPERQRRRSEATKRSPYSRMMGSCAARADSENPGWIRRRNMRCSSLTGEMMDPLVSICWSSRKLRSRGEVFFPSRLVARDVAPRPRRREGHLVGPDPDRVAVLEMEVLEVDPVPAADVVVPCLRDPGDRVELGARDLAEGVEPDVADEDADAVYDELVFFLGRLLVFLVDHVSKMRRKT